jgi:hypothetical protein
MNAAPLRKLKMALNILMTLNTPASFIGKCKIIAAFIRKRLADFMSVLNQTGVRQS